MATKKVRIFKVNSFTGPESKGNPAAVCLLDKWLPVECMQQIAAVNALPETAFVVSAGTEGVYELKWFTPEIEMDLCGHATLAAAFALFNSDEAENDSLLFNTASGALEVFRVEDLIILDFPSRPPVEAVLPELILKALGKAPLQVLKARDYILVYEDEESICNLDPDQELLRGINLDTGGISVTAPGTSSDFVSRFFTPGASIFEDPVTGSAHCSLIPYWARRLGKDVLHASQISERRGELECRNAGNRVHIGGYGQLYFKGYIKV